MRNRLKKGESPRAGQSNRGLSEYQSLPGVESFSMTTLPESEQHDANTKANTANAYVFDLLEGKNQDNAEFDRERATRELQSLVRSIMGSYGLHAQEAINVATEAARRFQHDWQDVADRDLPESWRVAEVLEEVTGASPDDEAPDHCN